MRLFPSIDEEGLPALKGARASMYAHENPLSDPIEERTGQKTAVVEVIIATERGVGGPALPLHLQSMCGGLRVSVVLVSVMPVVCSKCIRSNISGPTEQSLAMSMAFVKPPH